MSVTFDPPAVSPSDQIRPFQIAFAQEAIDDMQRRVAQTRWPDREWLPDRSQGVQLSTVQELARHWATYDWRRAETRFNGFPQFLTEIDGLDIHFIHVRSSHPNALPLIITHGWPGSFIEQLKVIGPLTDPTAFGGSPEDAFDVVIPSLPGHGFSGKPVEPGWDPPRIARAWIVLMKRLGYTRFVAQGGDWGNAVSEQMALLAPPELLGISTNMSATVPAEISAALAKGERRRQHLLPTSGGHGISSTSSTRRASATRTRWPCGRRRCTHSRTPRSGSRRGCSTTTMRATPSSHASSPANRLG